MPIIYDQSKNATFKPEAINALTLSTRGKPAPIYTMGSPNPRSFGSSAKHAIQGQISLFKPFLTQFEQVFDVLVQYDDEFGQKVQKTVYGVQIDYSALLSQLPALTVANLNPGDRITLPAGTILDYKARDAGPLTFVKKYGPLGTALRKNRKVLV